MPQDCLEFKQFKAWVNIDGEKTPCYAVEVDKKERTVSGWIASEKGKEFWVGINKMDKSRCAVRVTCYVDTLNVGRNFFKKSELAWVKFDSLMLSKKAERPFVFSSVNLTDDDAYLEPSLDEKKKGAIGELTFKVHRVTRLITKRTKRNRDDTSEEDDSEEEIKLEKVHERSKAGITMQHQAGLGEKRLKAVNSDDDVIEDRYYDTSVYSEIKELIATFTFRYRSLEVLQASGIAPRERKDDELPTNDGPKEVIVINEDGATEEPANPQPAIIDPEPDVPARHESIEPQQQSPDGHPLSPVSPPAVSGLEESTSGTLLSSQHDISAGGRQSLTPPLNSSTSTQSSELFNPATSVNPLKRTASEVDTAEEISEDKIKTDPDMDGVEARKIAILAELAQIERLQEMQRAAGPSAQKRVKREPSAPVMFFKPGEVIDLT
ncbi:hypothetical protein CPB83DRAFT_844863 [Crepidotus variabilis]|uniref:DUF7918 domain-containing protein n=1 Tax=Crepidotus variabilis TaxID=179855 RepID=A0A9P6JUZ1_9AGAR|nr:hypothetical protein CPB83DRAFT_844863 [Crepidotus variabilis]